MRSRPSSRLRTISFVVTKRFRNEPSSDGSTKNSAMENASPSTTENVMSAFCAFSEDRRFSSQASKRPGSLPFSSSSSSAKKSAEYMRAETPVFMDVQKLKMPRMNGSFFGDHFCESFRGSTLRCRPSFVRTTTADFSGPSIIMPSMRACPPIMVLNCSCGCCVFFFAMCFLSIALQWGAGW